MFANSRSVRACGAGVIESRVALEIRVRGTVQGVGFRPNVWRLAQTCGVVGDVCNDADGVLIHAAGDRESVERFIALIRDDAPPLARIASLEVARALAPFSSEGFEILASGAGRARTQIAADAAICAACREEVLDPRERRARYPFANCTHCGPRLSIVVRIPYDRANTTMSPFALCADCAREYDDPRDRRFHAQPIACALCGPRARLIRFDESEIADASGSLDVGDSVDAVDAARALLSRGEIVAIKGIGGYQFACDATNRDAVATLRARKVREEKPFALMAEDLVTIRWYCSVDAAEEALLRSSATPIVLLRASGRERLPDAVAPGMAALGFMLPATPLHVLLMRNFGRPLVMTSGNRSSEPQAIDDEDARERLKSIASYALVNDRVIAGRIDDSVARVSAGSARVLRRARGYSPEPIALPAGFARAPQTLALGAELKATFCLGIDGTAVVSQHQGDLEDAATFADYRHNLRLYEQLFDRAPRAIVVDRHPDYLSTKYGRERAELDGAMLLEVQHHHAHIASVLAECDRALAAPPVLGIALDGLGYGDGGELWGGEFLLADYREHRRLGTFKPIRMLGGSQAIREPWRNTYAHVISAFGWAQFEAEFGELDLVASLAAKPRAVFDSMLATGLASPRASSCGRLFDAVAAALGFARERATFEGQAAMLLEAAVDRAALGRAGLAHAYPFAISSDATCAVPYLEPRPMWEALLHDLSNGVAIGTISARFHLGLADALAEMTSYVLASLGDALSPVSRDAPAVPDTVALSGGCFQNDVLLEATIARLEAFGLRVLANARVPANDGGISLGQTAIAAALLLDSSSSGSLEAV